MSESVRRYNYLFVCVFLALSTFALYWPVHGYEFVHFDDAVYVAHNQNVNTGLSWKNIKWAFNIGYASNWHPLTWLSHMLDCELFGDAPGAHHITNVVFHIANTILLFIVLCRMTKALWASAFVAALFALHPLHVESVVWIAERKDVLSTFFWMLTMLAYVRYTEKPGAVRYITALLLFATGLMAKPMLVTLPFILLLLDYWPMGRFLRKKISGLVLEKMPFFVLSALSSVITVIAQRAGGSVVPAEALSVKVRLVNAVVSYIVYIGKMFWPSRLAVLYPHPGAAAPVATVIICSLLLLFLSVGFLCLAGRYGFLIVGWLWYIITLVPVLGIVQVGAQSMADRYTYIPLTGLFIITAWSVREVVLKFPVLKIISAFVCVVILAALSLCSLVQLTYWKDSSVLFKHAIDVTNSNYIMHGNYGDLLKDAGRLDEAIGHYNQSLRIKPDYYKVYNNLGIALERKGKFEEAVNCFQKVIELTKDKRLKPNQPAGFAEAHCNLATILGQQGQYEQAIEHFRVALTIRPDDAKAHFSLAVLLLKQGRTDSAIESFRRALQIAPEFEQAKIQLNAALESQKSSR
jgi:Flp pilus assembly protein TadD